MKKRIVSLAAVLLLSFLFTAASAELHIPQIDDTFSVRNDISHKLSRNQVDDLEKQYGSTVDNLETYYADTDPYDLCYDTTLAGYVADISYWFNENDELEEFQYLLYQESAYTDVKNALIQKYGAPLYTSFGNIAGTRIDVPNKELSILAPIIRDYNGWILQYNDCYVFLEISNVLFSKAGSGIPLYLVNYKMLTYEEMEEYLAIQQGFMEYVNNSFHNDL